MKPLTSENQYNDDFMQRSHQLKDLLNMQKNTPSQTLTDHTNTQNKSSRTNISCEVSKLNSYISDLFLYTKQQLDEGFLQYIQKIIPIQEMDKEKVLQSDPILILQYTKQIICQLITQKSDAEKMLEQNDENQISAYEQSLQKLEAEVRQHIRIEQQLKLYAENTQEKLETVQKEKNAVDSLYNDLKIKYDEGKKQMLKQQDYIFQLETQTNSFRNSQNHMKSYQESIKSQESQKHDGLKMTFAKQNNLAQQIQQPPIIYESVENPTIYVSNQEDRRTKRSTTSHISQNYMSQEEKSKNASNVNCQIQLQANKEMKNNEFIRMHTDIDPIQKLNSNYNAKYQEEINYKQDRPIYDKGEKKDEYHRESYRESHSQKPQFLENNSNVSLKQPVDKNQQKSNKNKNKSKYQEYSTLDSDRIKTLNKKINDLQSSLTQRGCPPPQEPKRTERSNSNLQNSSKQIKQSILRPPSAMDKHEMQPQQPIQNHQMQQGRGQEDRSYSLDGNHQINNHQPQYIKQKQHDEQRQQIQNKIPNSIYNKQQYTQNVYSQYQKQYK